MANTGPDLIAAILGNASLMALNNCPAVSAQMSRAFYGVTQNDSGTGENIASGATQKQINEAIGFGGANSETAVWHFFSGSPVHHFVVVPWYKHDFPHGQVYSVFMAYELSNVRKYTVQQYVRGEGDLAPATGGNGYKLVWTPTELATMLSDLVNTNTAWESYFGRVGPARTMKLTYWKYKTVSLASAIANVRRYS